VNKQIPHKIQQMILDARRQSGKPGSKERKKKLLEYVDKIQIEIPALSPEVLVKKACDGYNELQQERNNWGFRRADINNSQEFLVRIEVNYLRHQVCRYEYELNRLFGKFGVEEAYLQLNQKIFDAIINSYPHLQEECKRQMNLKREEKVPCK